MNALPMPTSVGVFFGESLRINMSPRYQRDGGIWSLGKQQLFIDSLLNGYDIPKIYFHDVRDDESRYSYAVIDGKQRLSTITDFMENKFPLGKDFKFLREDLPDGKRPEPGSRYDDFSDLFKDYFKNVQLPVVLVQRATEDDIEELFSRLNSGEKVNSAEARNAKGGAINELIDTLESHKFFREKVGFENTRFKYREVLCRLLYIDWHEMKTPGTTPDLKKKNLDDFVEFHCHDLLHDDKKKLEKMCSKNLDIMCKVFPTNKSDELRQITIPQLYYIFVREITREYYHPQLLKLLSDFFPKFLMHKKSVVDGGEEWPSQDEVIVFKNYNYYSGQGTNSSDGMSHRIEILTEYFLLWNADIEIKNRDRDFTQEERYVIWLRDGKKCQQCGADLVNSKEMDADHIQEYSQNGPTTLANARALCVSCNRGRPNRNSKIMA